MAGANGPTSAAGTPDIPNPRGGTDGGEARNDAHPEAAVPVERPPDGTADGAKAGEAPVRGEGGPA